MDVKQVIMPDGARSWGVIENQQAIDPIHQYLTYLYHLQRSPNTIRAYAYHLKHFWEYLSESSFTWSLIKLHELAGFITWLRAPCSNVVPVHQAISKRTESSINAALAAVTAFYKFHEQINNVDSLELYSTKIAINPKYKPFLNHLNTKHLTKARTLKIKVPTILPKVVDPHIIKQMLNACYYIRDKLLICMLYETGMRIGQLLGLQHQDIKSWDNEIQVVPRINNPNHARAKLSQTNVLTVTQSLMKLYTTYLLSECHDIDSQYVFVCLKGQKRGQPLRYEGVQDLFKRLSKTVNQKVTPHMLRHTHATELIQQGWDMALVKKRLGHQSIQTTINIYTHLNQQDIKEAFKKYEQRSVAHDCIES